MHTVDTYSCELAHNSLDKTSCVLPPRLHGTSLPIQAPGHQEEGGEASLVDGEMRAEAPSKLVAPEAVSRAERDSDWGHSGPAACQRSGMSMGIPPSTLLLRREPIERNEERQKRHG